jgi:hypothetical protein
MKDQVTTKDPADRRPYPATSIVMFGHVPGSWVFPNVRPDVVKRIPNSFSSGIGSGASASSYPYMHIPVPQRNRYKQFT